MNYAIREFGEQHVEIFIYNERTMISFSNLGARINRWQGENGENLILGHDTYADALVGKAYYFGTTVGRVAGRLAEGRYNDIQLDINSEGHHLHGGSSALDWAKWEYEIEEGKNYIAVNFQFTDLAGNNGYPGNLIVEVKHTYTQGNEWIIEYKAQTDQETLFNPTNHVYFNLNGNNKESILNHYLQVKADKYIPLKEGGVPIGSKLAVENTMFDLNYPLPLNKVLTNLPNEQLKLVGGYDHPFELSGEKEYDAKLFIKDPSRSIYMQTDRPAVVIYTFNSVEENTIVWGNPLKQHHGITLETQILPDALSHKNFGNIVLMPNDNFYSKTIYTLEEG